MIDIHVLAAIYLWYIFVKRQLLKSPLSEVNQLHFLLIARDIHVHVWFAAYISSICVSLPVWVTPYSEI